MLIMGARVAPDHHLTVERRERARLGPTII
jgi:hypothetical protein